MAACTSSGEISYEEVEIVCVSGREDGMEVFFKVPEGVQCEGIQVTHTGNEAVLTFIQEGNPAELQLTSRAVLSEEGPFVGSLIVDVPISKAARSSGNKFVMRVSGDSSTTYSWKPIKSVPIRTK